MWKVIQSKSEQNPVISSELPGVTTSTDPVNDEWMPTAFLMVLWPADFGCFVKGWGHTNA